jgi:hypothetical protein
MTTLFDSNDGELCRPVNVNFNEQTGFLQVNLAKTDYDYVDRPVRYQGRIFQPKGELHITIISQDSGVLLHYLARHPQDLDSIRDLIYSTDWSFRKLPDFYHVESGGGEESIIQMVDVPDMVPFLRSLSNLVEHGFVLPPTHVTLYTLGTVLGIPLPNAAVFRERARTPIHASDLHIA